MVEQKARGVSGAVRRGVGEVAGETLRTTGSAARGATGAVSAATGTDAVENAGKQVQQAARGAAGAVESVGGGGGQRTLREELREIVREASLEIIVPVARRATMQAAKYAITRGPQLARDTIAPKLADTFGSAIEEAGGPAAFAKGALASVSSTRAGMLEKVGIGGERQARPWQERRLPVEESIDVVVPLETAYDRFAEFDEYAKVLARGEAIDERPHERIAWERTDGVEAAAVITFHRLSHRLTRVMVTYDHDPQGLLERTTSLFRTARRGLIADLMRFKAFAEMTDTDTEPPREDAKRRAEPRARRRIAPRRDEGEDADEDEGAAPEGEEPAHAPTRPVRPRSSARSRQQKRRRG